MDNKQTGPPTFIHLPIDTVEAARKLPTLEIIAYTGGFMNVPGWGPLCIDLNGLEAGQVAVLADQNKFKGSDTFLRNSLSQKHLNISRFPFYKHSTTRKSLRGVPPSSRCLACGRFIIASKKKFKQISNGPCICR